MSDIPQSCQPDHGVLGLISHIGRGLVSVSCSGEKSNLISEGKGVRGGGKRREFALLVSNLLKNGFASVTR